MTGSRAVSITDIEQRYSSNAYVRVGHRDVRGYADGTCFIFESVLRIADIVLETATPAEEAARLVARLDVGIPVAALELNKLPMTLQRAIITTRALTRWETRALNARGVFRNTANIPEQRSAERS
jgi:hypothetical protein